MSGLLPFTLGYSSSEVSVRECPNDGTWGEINHLYETITAARKTEMS
jgi:hypothetical protein